MNATLEKLNTAVTQRNFDLRIEQKLYDLRCKGFCFDEQMVFELKAIGIPITNDEDFIKAYIVNGGSRKWKNMNWK